MRQRNRTNRSGILNVSKILFLSLVLIFLSSCNVRKSIQAFFNIPQTKPLNISKTTLTNTGNHCNILTDSSSDKVANTSLADLHDGKLLLFIIQWFSPSSEKQKLPTDLFFTKKAGSIALFILYQRLKIPTA